MAIIHLKPFQEKAIADLRRQFLELWKTTNRKLPLVFKAPTGSGKTVMVAFDVWLEGQGWGTCVMNGEVVAYDFVGYNKLLSGGDSGEGNKPRGNTEKSRDTPMGIASGSRQSRGGETQEGHYVFCPKCGEQQEFLVRDGKILSGDEVADGTVNGNLNINLCPECGCMTYRTFDNRCGKCGGAK